MNSVVKAISSSMSLHTPNLSSNLSYPLVVVRIGYPKSLKASVRFDQYGNLIKTHDIEVLARIDLESRQRA